MGGGALDGNDAGRLVDGIGNETQMFGEKEESDLDLGIAVGGIGEGDFSGAIMLHIAIEDFQ
jgi:hypothetical protein